MATPKQAHALVTYFKNQYNEKYNHEPVVNRYSARWGFDAVLMEMDTSAVKKLIDYYLTTVSTNGHSLEWFFYNYDKLIVAKITADEDEQRLARLREESRLRAERWRKKIDEG